MRELLEADKKKKKSKVSRTQAAGTYHRDYETTKKRPYRKYDPTEQHNEGWEIGGNGDTRNTPIPSNTRVSTDVVQQPTNSEDSSPEELQQLLTELVELLAQYDKLKSSGEDHEEEPQQEEQPSHSGATQQQGGENPATNAPLQFSTFLYKIYNGVKLTELVQSNNPGVDNNMSGGDDMSGGDNTSGNDTKDDFAQDDDSSPEQGGDLASVKKEASQLIRQILDSVKQLGSDASEQLQQLCAKHCGDEADRVMSVLTQAAEKLDIQI